MKFNINNNVKVKLTDLGRDVHKAYWAPYIIDYDTMKPKEDSDGWSTFQLWVLMHVFGPHLNNGGIAPFETEIEF